MPHGCFLKLGTPNMHQTWGRFELSNIFLEVSSPSMVHWFHWIGNAGNHCFYLKNCGHRTFLHSIVALPNRPHHLGHSWVQNHGLKYNSFTLILIIKHPPKNHGCCCVLYVGKSMVSPNILSESFSDNICF